jgi:4'-phosphopantetheinyl transferase
MLAAASWPDRNEVQVFVADARAIGADRDRVAEALRWMPAAERARFEQFRHDEDRMMFAVGRLMARTLVGRALSVDPSAWAWREGPHGRPEIDQAHTNLRFNLSHSAGLVICALARDREIGVDVEDLTRRAPDPAIVPRYCSPAEADDVRSHGDRWRDRFLTYWTLKEAYVKARGVGISVPLSEISFTLDAQGARIGFAGSLAGTDPQWAFHLWHAGATHLAAVAAHAADGVAPAFLVQPF